MFTHKLHTVIILFYVTKKGFKMSKKAKLAGILLGAAISTTTMVASGMNDGGKCGAGKCGGDMKKKEMKSGKCGAGKCGSN